MAYVLDETVFRQIRDFIYERSGIFIPDSKKYLIENRLSRRISENRLSGFEEYLNFLKFSADGNELTKLFDAITTNETYFFREPQHFEVLLNNIIPDIMSRKGLNSINIWSSACSTGEEPYTIAMLLKEAPHIKCEIIASDISISVLDSAKKGVYSSYSIRNVPENFLKKYFKKNGLSYEIDASIKKSVKFKQINLFDEKALRIIRNIDVVFCRNVLIYFDDRAKQKVLSHLYDSIAPYGYLFIGASETLHNLTRAFKPIVINKVVAYKKL